MTVNLALVSLDYNLYKIIIISNWNYELRLIEIWNHKQRGLRNRPPIICEDSIYIKKSYYHRKKSHSVDKTVVISSYLNNGNSYPEKEAFYIESGPCFFNTLTNMHVMGLDWFGCVFIRSYLWKSTGGTFLYQCYVPLTMFWIDLGLFSCNYWHHSLIHTNITLGEIVDFFKWTSKNKSKSYYASINDMTYKGNFFL